MARGVMAQPAGLFQVALRGTFPLLVPVGQVLAGPSAGERWLRAMRKAWVTGQVGIRSPAAAFDRVAKLRPHTWAIFR